MRLAITALAIFLTLTGMTHAAPVINSVNTVGLPADGLAITISGSAFGAQGPSLHIFDNFDDGGTVGNPINFAATVGSWWGFNTNPTTYDNIGMSGDRSMRIFTGSNGDLDAQIVKANFPATTEFFLSYWLYIPVGSTFPGSSDPNYLPNNYYSNTFNPSNTNCSTWKIVWIFDGDNASNNNDITMPTYVCGYMFMQGNNTRGFGINAAERIGLIEPLETNHDYLTNPSIKFRYGQWMRFTFWAKANESDVLLPGNVRWSFEIPTSNIHEIRTDNTKPVFCGPPDPCTEIGGPKPPYQWTHMNFTGYTGHGGDWSLTRPLMDDVYLATGAGAQARVEVCDNPVYLDCQKFGVVTISNSSNWTDTSISGTIRKGAMTSEEIKRAYLYVFDKDGNVNSSGFQLCPSCPKAPTNVRVE